MVKLEDGKTKKRSLIKKYFSDEVYFEILKATMIADADNNEKGEIIKDILNQNGIPFNGLGHGTNRMGLLIDGYAFKFALDNDGKIDNLREAKYAKNLYPYVVKVYEVIPSGLISVTEFVEIFDMDDFNTRRGEMADILSEISKSYLIGDVGITSKNYVNWGKRLDGSICILDFAYIYSVTYNTFKCTACDNDSLLSYDDSYNKLVCPTCGHKYEFKDIRRRITKKEQAEEIGDIRTVGYNIHSDGEIVDIIKEFEPEDINKPKKKKKPDDEVKRLNKEHRKQLKEQKRAEKECCYWD